MFFVFRSTTAADDMPTALLSHNPALPATAANLATASP